MVPSEDAGLVLPPKLATQMKKQVLRVKVDNRDCMCPGTKHFEWEYKGGK